MRSLILFRHGKSDWDTPFTSDHDRQLAQRGRESAKVMGRFLQHVGQVPELAVASTAVRARDTLQLAARAGHWNSPMRTEAALYESTPAKVVDWLQTLDSDASTLLLVGHEPTWSELAGELIGRAVVRVPTGAMLRIDFHDDNDSWQALRPGSGELRWLLPPKLVGRLMAKH